MGSCHFTASGLQRLLSRHTKRGPRGWRRQLCGTNVIEPINLPMPLFSMRFMGMRHTAGGGYRRAFAQHHTGSTSQERTSLAIPRADIRTRQTNG
ncbi:hypothetical protein Bxe_C1300 [Paraburkholderia xenovorans LB400]|uniref:Uncharacterized protein n=1 Tax=Paraburkholderia xenovorans (strain LB400) TaxID=266265 RepID=Q13FI0_PARXL|nr:hypothetical protein Bxe_C1300 [Paraburkholderia xenovorans LB400]